MNLPSSTASNNKSAWFARAASLSLLALIILCVLEEMWLAPLRPHGSWLVLKIVPLLFALKGVASKDNYTMQWSSMLILLYFTEGIVRATSDRSAISVQLSWLEVLLSLVFFYCTLSYLRPIKKAAKALQKAAPANDADYAP